MSGESESVQKLLKDRYFLSNETSWEQLGERVSDIYPPIKDSIINKVFIPSTPTLLNANTKGERFGTLSSCFPMGIDDSIVGIFDALKEAAIVTKMGGGVGYDFSILRSSHEEVDSIRRSSSGPLPFAKIFNSMLDGIQQGGVRRGAGMALLSIYHPDILNFIEIKQDIYDKKDKQNGKNEMERMNLSVKVPDSFYKTLKNSPESHHKVKDVKTGKTYPLKDKNGNFVTTQEIWNRIINSAWKVAEPGIFNETIAHDRCTVTNVSKTVICNPCFTGDTLIAVADGRGEVPIKQLAEEGKDVPVYTFDFNGNMCIRKLLNTRLTRKNADVYEVEFNSGAKVKCTEDHNFLTIKGKMIALKDLKVGDHIFGAKKHTNTGVVWEYNDSLDLEEEMELGIKYHSDSENFRRCENCDKIFEFSEDSKGATFCSEKCLNEYSKRTFDLDTNENCFSNYYIVKKTYIGKEDVYDGAVEDFHNLLVCGKTDGNIKDFIVAKQCNEFTNIPYSSCNLGSINLSKLVKDKDLDWESFGNIIKDATLFLNNAININNYPIEKIKDVTSKIRPIGLGIMGLSSLFFKLHIPYNSNKAIKLSEEIARYITLKSMEVSVDLAKENKKSYESFDYDLFIKANERFFKKDCREINIEKLKSDIKKYGIYNSCFTSFAPTGSIATIANTSNGIEPVFALAFTRNIEKLNKEYDKMYIVDPIFEEYVNENFPDKKIKIYEEVAKNGGSCQKCLDIPEEDRKVFITANELTVSEHLDILEALANNVSLAISKTINMSKTATEEEVSEVFIEAHKRGIIGVTVYRDGCRGEGVLVRDNSKNDSSDDFIIRNNNAPKRPERIKCDIYHKKIAKKLDKVRSLEYIVVVGLDNEGKPYEVFAFENGKLDKKYTKGETVKKARGKYNIELEDGTKLADIAADQTADEETITRSISCNLRHGVKPEFIVHQIEKSREEPTGFVKSIGWALKKYIKEGTNVSGLDCPDCSKKGEKGNIIREAGCVKCLVCNWSKCG